MNTGPFCGGGDRTLKNKIKEHLPPQAWHLVDQGEEEKSWKYNKRCNLSLSPTLAEGVFVLSRGHWSGKITELQSRVLIDPFLNVKAQEKWRFSQINCVLKVVLLNYITLWHWYMPCHTSIIRNIHLQKHLTEGCISLKGVLIYCIYCTV